MEIPCGAERVSKHPEESKQILDKANKMEHGQWGQRSQPGTHMNWTPSVRGDNVSMDRRICRRAKDGAWSVGLEKSARYAYELGPQCQRGDNVSMDRRIHPSAGNRLGTWSTRSETSARYAYELESPSVKEAAILV